MSKPVIDLEQLRNFIPFDSLTDSHLEEIRGQIGIMNLGPQRIVFKRDSSTREAFFLISGAVDLTDEHFEVRHFPADDDENYLALDNYRQHRVNCITTEPTIFYTIDREHLDLLMTWTQAAEAMVEEEDDQAEVDWMEALLQSGVFSQVPPSKIQSLFVKFEEREVQLGEVIVREGEPGDTFYVIKKGKAMVTREKAGREATVAALTSGHYFGEDALISNAPRNATITMTSDGVLMCLDQDSFREILQETVIQTITEEKMEELSEEGDRACVLLDVRLPMEFKHDRRPGARNIPLTNLRQEIKSLEKDFIYVVSCDGGGRSQLGAYLLSGAGLEAYVLEQPQGQSDDEEHAREEEESEAGPDQT